MNRDDIIRMALDAGADFLEARTGDCFIFDAENGSLERFANLVAAAEREACAKVCQQAIEESENTNAELSPTEILEKAVIAGAIHQAHRIDAAIRARGQQ